MRKNDILRDVYCVLLDKRGGLIFKRTTRKLNWLWKSPHVSIPKHGSYYTHSLTRHLYISVYLVVTRGRDSCVVFESMWRSRRITCDSNSITFSVILIY